MSEKGNKIINLKFNHSATSLFISTTQGFRIFRLEDSKIISRRDRILSINFQGGFKYILPLFDSQKVVLVGTSENQKYQRNKLVLWDEYQALVQSQVEFSSEILNISARREYIVAALISSVNLIRVNNFEDILKIDTGDNPKGIIAISKTGNVRLIFPGKNIGELHIENVAQHSFICKKVHENYINCASISDDGSKGASCSEQGTVIRVFDCNNFEILYELRRGTTPANISCLTFSMSCVYLAATSNRGTIHIWNLYEMAGEGKGFWMIPSCLQYKRSYIKIKICPEISWICEDTQTGPSVCFEENRYLFIAHFDGNVYCYEINNELAIHKKIGCFLDFEEEIIEDDCEWTSLD